MASDIFAVGVDALPYSGTLIVSGDYKAADPAPAEFTPLGATGIVVIINITAQTGAGNTLTVHIDAWDPASQTWIADVLVSAGLVATGSGFLTVDPRVVAAANVKAQMPLFQKMRVRPVKSGTTTTLNYSVGLTLAR